MNIQAPRPTGCPATPYREFAFLLADTARLLRTLTDQRAKAVGSTRAQWAVLARLQRCEGQSQNELAAALDIQPITLGRLVDKLCEDGLVERRPDPTDRRINRLHLTDKATPVLERLSLLGRDMMEQALEGIRPETLDRMVEALGCIKDNLKAELKGAVAEDKAQAL
jgi:MarR family transcriptional regulator for hemolysin